MVTLVTPEILEELGFLKTETGWQHEKGMFIYDNKIPSTLKVLVSIMTGTAYRKGQNSLSK